MLQVAGLLRWLSSWFVKKFAHDLFLGPRFLNFFLQTTSFFLQLLRILKKKVHNVFSKIVPSNCCTKSIFDFSCVYPLIILFWCNTFLFAYMYLNCANLTYFIVCVCLKRLEQFTLDDLICS